MQRPEDNGRILLYQFLPYPLRPDLLLNLGLGVFFSAAQTGLKTSGSLLSLAPSTGATAALSFLYIGAD